MEQSNSTHLISLLHPKIREEALNAYEIAVKSTPAGVHPIITQSLRTFAEQDALFAQGRTKQGKRVTNARGGQSLHNYGLALDFDDLINGVMDWHVDRNWMIVANTFKSLGWEWGGGWVTLKDYPHVQKVYGHSWRDLLQLHNQGKVDNDGYVLI